MEIRDNDRLNEITIRLDEVKLQDGRAIRPNTRLVGI